MTNANTTTTEETTTVKETKLTKSEVLTTLKSTTEEWASAVKYLKTTRYNHGKVSVKEWVKIGGLVARVKAAKLPGGIEYNVALVLGVELTTDERTYSQRLADKGEAIIKWYNDSKCTKSSARTIHGAYVKATTEDTEDKTEDNEDGEEKAPKNETAKTAMTLAQAITNVSNINAELTKNKTLTIEDESANIVAIELILEKMKANKAIHEKAKAVKAVQTETKLRKQA